MINHRQIVLLVIALVLPLASCSGDDPAGPGRGALRTAVSIQDDGGPSLRIVVSVTNGGGQSMKLGFGSTEVVGYRVTDATGSTVVKYPVSRTGIDNLLKIGAHEEKLWKLPLMKDQMLPGRHVVAAGLLDHEALYPWARAEYVRQ